MHRIAALTTATLLAALFLSPAASAQETDPTLREELEALKAGQRQIRRELAEIKRLLQTRGAQPGRTAPNVAGVAFDLGANPVLGADTAKVTLVEFTDYQWPYCARHVRETYPQIAEQYIETGKVRFATLDLPLERIHPLAFKAAQATHCAEEQGRFWEMHDRLFENQRQLEPWSAHGEALGLDVASFDACMTSDRHDKAIRADMTQAAKAGATGTPGFLIAVTDSEDPSNVTGVSTLRGALPFANFKTALDEALASLDANAPPDGD